MHENSFLNLNVVLCVPLKEFILNEASNLNNNYTIAFYNVENLFDIYDDPDTKDDDFTPEGKKKWDEKRYQRKIKKISSVISQIGVEESGFSPAIVGLAEVENKQVVLDLIHTENLKHNNYGIVHFDSPDERGIEVAFLYRKKVFELLHSESFPLLIYDEEGERDFTRDVLLVKGKLKGKLIYFIVNHWPSRRQGTGTTEVKRIKAAELVQQIITKIKDETQDPTIILMGDFNDNPTNISVKKHLVTSDFFNPFESLFNKGFGSLIYQKKWLLFDQIILNNKFKNDSNLLYDKAYIFGKNFLVDRKGKHKGDPFRTYIGKWHQGGFSDHFPVYVELKISE